MTRSDRRLRGKLLALGLLLTLLAVGLDKAGWLEPPENWLYDRRARMCQWLAPPPSPDIIHLDIDDASIEAVGRWPWPRSTFAEMMDEVGMAQPKAVALDILYIDPAEPRWQPEPGPDGKPQFVKIDEDEVLAASFRRMGNVLVPLTMRIEEAPHPSALEQAIRGLLTSDLELDEKGVAAALRASGGPQPGGPRDLEQAFLAARREVAQQLVRREWDQLDRPGPAGSNGSTTRPSTEPATQPTTQPGTQPATQPDTQPATQPVSAVPLPFEETELAIMRRLLPHTDLTVSTPLRLVVDEAYHHVEAERAVRRFGFPRPPGLPPLFHPSAEAFPVPVLSDAAAATAFVDYPKLKDGVVRAVPLLQEYNGRVYPQMGLMFACMILGVDVKDLRYTPDSITIPLAGKPDGKGGTYRDDIVIPVETWYSKQLDQPVPMFFRVPWVGGQDWAAMYDVKHPWLQKQHLSINVVWDICRTRQKLEEDNRNIDTALKVILDVTGEASVRSFLEHAPPAAQPLSRQVIVASTERVLKGLSIPVDQLPADKDVTDPNERVLFRAIRAMRDSEREGELLAAQLNNQRQFLRSQLRGKGVLVGAVGTGMDLKTTSVHPAAPGVVIHGTIANGILTRNLYRASPVAAAYFAAALVGILTTLIVSMLGPSRASAITFLLGLGLFALNWVGLFAYSHHILSVAGSVAAITLVWVGGTLVRVVVEGIERARITRRFRSYVDPSLVDYVLEHPEQSVFAGEQREMTVVFTDLQGFTAVSEKLGTEIIPLLNELMGIISAVVKKHNGFVNKFMGDGVMFFFNAPEPNANHASDALAAVLDIHVALDEFDRHMVERGLPVLSLRAGVCTGLMVVGDAGSAERSDYTVLGDNVNLASRLESANKATGTDTLVVERTIELVGDAFFVRPVGRICVVGQTIPVMTYHVMANAGEETAEQKRLAELTREMVDAFLDARPADCLEAVARLEEAFGESKLSHLYRDKCLAYLKDPNPGEFDCQIVLTSK